MEVVMQAMIGVDPHKATHTAVVVNDREDELGRKKVRACRTQVTQLLSWTEPFPRRTWAIEGADGLGYLLAQQLVAAGESVVDVPAPWRPEPGCWPAASRIRRETNVYRFDL
jgi:transposase